VAGYNGTANLRPRNSSTRPAMPGPAAGRPPARLPPCDTPPSATLLPNARFWRRGDITVHLLFNGGNSSTRPAMPGPEAGRSPAPWPPRTTVKTAMLLPSGKLFIVGGSSTTVLSTAELYDPGNRVLGKPSATVTSARYLHTATVLPNGKALIAGGGVATTMLYDPVTATWSAGATDEVLANRSNRDASSHRQASGDGGNLALPSFCQQRNFTTRWP